MSCATVLYTLLVIVSIYLPENADAQSNSYDIIKSMASITEAFQNLSRVVQNLHLKVEGQENLLNNLVTKEEGQTTVLSNLVNKVDNLQAKAEYQEPLVTSMSSMAEEQRTMLNKLDTKIDLQSTTWGKLQDQVEVQRNFINSLSTKEDLQSSSINLERKVEGQFTLLNNLLSKVDIQATVLNTLATKSEMQSQMIQLNNLEAKVKSQEALLTNMSSMAETLERSFHLQTTTLNNSMTKEESQETLLSILQSNLTTVGVHLERLSDHFHKSVAHAGSVEGIIAGTWDGVVIIPLTSGQQWNISSTFTYGVAFDWNTRKVYWVDFNQKAIKRANLDGTSMKIIILDDSTLRGIAVDPVTGNFYYGISSSNEIRVCDRSGQKCAVIAVGARLVGGSLWDIALYPSQGIMFWSEYGNRNVVRSNMDGGDARIIISEDVDGIWADESSQRLYWSNNDRKIIGSHDFNGQNRKVLLTKRLDPMDVEVDGDMLFFGNLNGRSVYSVNQNGQLAFIANTTGRVYHIALYGRNRVPSRRNPCHPGACPNVCVLNRESYTCL